MSIKIKTNNGWVYVDGHNSGSTVIIDPTLTVPGAAADAKNTGDIIRDIRQIPTGGTVGQVLTRTDDGVSWANPSGGTYGISGVSFRFDDDENLIIQNSEGLDVYMLNASGFTKLS